MVEQKSQQRLTEQERAKAAWAGIQEIVDLSKEQAKYGTLARKLPAMLQTNGLGQTLAFLQAKGGQNQNDAHNLIYKHISVWVKKWMQVDENKDLLEWVIHEDSDKYRRATAESIVFSIWLRRLAEAKEWGSAEGDD